MSNNNYKHPTPITEQNWPVNTEPLVSIQCITYNHENYIRDAIEGFLIQKTTFPVEILIHDDASTDKTACIVREYETKYPQFIKPIYQTENKYSTQRGYITRIQNKRTKGKYIAKCEGDDYWTDPLKLQKQVIFLENNPEYGMTYGDTLLTDENNVIKKFKKLEKIRRHTKKLGFPKVLFSLNPIRTLTVVMRAELIYDYYNSPFVQPEKNLGDLSLWIYIASRSKICGFNEIFGVYRILNSSASHSQDLVKMQRFRNDVLSIRLFYCEKLNLSKSHSKLAFQTHYDELAKLAFLHSNIKLAKSIITPLNFKKLTFKSYVLLFLTLLNGSIFKKLFIR